MRPTETPCTRSTARDPSPEAGQGYIALEQIDGRTIPLRLRANSPLKLLTPRRRSQAAWIIAGSYGGGLVSGDALGLEVHAGQGTTLFLGTQASTKIYRSTDGRSCRQILSLNAGAGSLCVIAPDPITPYAGSVYEQKQHIHLAESASLVLVDWLTAGRLACGERWAFSRYESRTDIIVSGRQVFRDALLLDSDDGSIDCVCRTGNFGCLATALLIGPAMEVNARALSMELGRAPAYRGGELVFAVSPVAGGIVLRIAGAGPEVVGRWLRARLAFIGELFGEDPWARIW